jgi:thiol:disulfide interchange protein
VVWLLWVLGLQRGIDALVSTLGALSVAFGILFVTRTMQRWIIAVRGMAVATLLVPLTVITSVDEESRWETFSEARLHELLEDRKKVFVEFTAAWCITCQVNKRLVLDSDEVQDVLEGQNVALLRADWTNRDESITRALERFGRSSVPTNVYYGVDGVFTIFPSILTKAMVVEAVRKP